MDKKIREVNHREVEHLVSGQATSDGAGVKLTRVLTAEWQQRLDPFLMLDVFATDNPDDYIGGFPEHPHRGFETITYMLSGRMRHRDSRGNEGVLEPGAVQWMTAGRGILHSEMPEQVDGSMEGFQLWLNLPAKNKMIAPDYQDVPADSIPLHEVDQAVQLRVIAGSLVLADDSQFDGAVKRPDTDPLFVDIQFLQSAEQSIEIPVGHHAFVYVYRGSLKLGEQSALVQAGKMAVLTDGDVLRLAADSQAKAIIVAGRPLNEPIAQYGPFVMNTRAQIMQAVEDMRAGKIGN